MLLAIAGLLTPSHIRRHLAKLVLPNSVMFSGVPRFKKTWRRNNLEDEYRCNPMNGRIVAKLILKRGSIEDAKKMIVKFYDEDRSERLKYCPMFAYAALLTLKGREDEGQAVIDRCRWTIVDAVDLAELRGLDVQAQQEKDAYSDARTEFYDQILGAKRPPRH